MTKEVYKNELKYSYDSSHNGSHYLIEGCDSYCNHGELCESIAKAHRGLFTPNNPNTAFDKGSDIEQEHTSVKSTEAQFARDLHGVTYGQQVKDFFLRVASKKFLWVEFDEETQMVTEYLMSKREFGAFVYRFCRVVRSKSNGTEQPRFRATSKKMIDWLENQCLAA